jgi:hypothetical protein
LIHLEGVLGVFRLAAHAENIVGVKAVNRGSLRSNMTSSNSASLMSPASIAALCTCRKLACCRSAPGELSVIGFDQQPAAGPQCLDQLIEYGQACRIAKPKLGGRE